MGDTNFIKAARDAAEQAARKHAEESGQPFDADKTRTQMNIGIGLALLLVLGFMYWWSA